MTLKETLEAREEIDRVLASSKGEELISDEYSRVSPQKSYLGLSAALRAEDYERAARYFDLSRLPDDGLDNAGETLAWIMRRVLHQFYDSRSLLERLRSLGVSSEGTLDDDLPPDFERLLSIPSRRGEVDFLLERVPREDGTPIWKFSARTVRELPELWEEYGYYGLEEYLPRSLFRYAPPFYLQPWQWIGLLLLAAAATVLGWLLSRVLRSTLLRVPAELSRQLGRFAPAPIGLFLGVSLFNVGTKSLRLAVASQIFVNAAVNLVIAIALTWIAIRMADVLLETLRRNLLRRSGTGLATVALPTLRRIAKILIVIVAAILFLDTLGFNVTALVAGLGVGGLAVALAAQRTIENLIGGLTLYADQPIRVGDLCRFGGTVGTVEAIGLRSTRIRTFDRTVVSVPNAEFVNLHLDNLTRRDKMWFHPKLGLRYETTPDQIRYVLVEIRRMLYAHPRVVNEGARIRFTGFGDYSLNLEIFAYVLATKYAEFLEATEDLNLRIMEIVTAAGTGFAFPSQTTYLEQGTPPEAEAAKAVGERVQEWREKNELFLPNFPNKAIDSLRGSVDYPNDGSPDAAQGQDQKQAPASARTKA